MNSIEIISQLPYEYPFLFVDELESISRDGVRGNYTFPADSYFYKGHFKNYPVTPGVILTECMAQIGLVCLGMILMKKNALKLRDTQVALTSCQVDFFIPVYPEEKVIVISEKEVFRFNKLKCKVKMLNGKGELVCKGLISGMLKISEKKS